MFWTPPGVSSGGLNREMNPIKKSVIAGSWYPGNPAVLRRDIEKYFDAVPEMTIDGKIVGLIAPHAGYLYSGHVAAHAYKLVRGRTYDAVMVVGPSHRVAFRGISIFSKGGYETPLGVVPVEEALADKLKKKSPIVTDIPQAHLQEHAVEIQLPFLQVALGQFSFLPLVMGSQDAATCRELAEAIADVSADKNLLIVGSSDLSHFYNYNAAKKMDAVALGHLKHGDSQGLLQSLENGDVEACGGGPMAVVMSVARMLKADRPCLLKYANSGDVTGDKESVVGYAAAVFYRSP